MFDYLGDKLSKAMQNIKGMGRITEENIADAMKEIRMALLEADVNYTVVKEFTNNVKEKALGLDVSKELRPEELFIKIVRDELISLLGGQSAPCLGLPGLAFGSQAWVFFFFFLIKTSRKRQLFPWCLHI